MGERDRTTTLTLGWLALVFMAAWAVVGMLDGGVRFVDAWRLHEAADRFTGWNAVLPAGAGLLLGMLWMAGLAALALGVALGVAALVLRGRGLRSVLLAVVAVAGVAVQLLCNRLTSWSSWSFATTDVPGSNLYAAAGALVASAVLLAALWLVLSPTLRRSRSSPEPAVVG